MAAPAGLRRALIRAIESWEPRDKSVRGLATHAFDSAIRIGQLSAVGGLAHEGLRDANGDSFRLEDYGRRAATYGAAGVVAPVAVGLAPGALATLGPNETMRLLRRIYNSLPKERRER